MPETAREPQNFMAFLADRSITPDAYSRMPEEMREYLRETWQLENHIPAEPAGQRASGRSEQTAEPSPWADLTANRGIMWVATACLVLVLIAIILPAVLRPAGSSSNPPPARPAIAPQPSVAAAPTTPSPTAPPIAAPAPVSTLPPPDTAWQQVARAGGSGTQRTALFPISGPKWRITWMTRPAAGKAPDDLHVNVYRADGSPVGPAALVRGESEGEAVLRGRGTFQVAVSSGQSYLIRIFDYR